MSDSPATAPLIFRAPSTRPSARASKPATAFSYWLTGARRAKSYFQVYLSILKICLTKKFGFSGLDINTAGAFVDPKNVDVVAPLAAKEIR